MKIFVSSVVAGFEAERDHACQLIENLGHEAIRCEQFGAHPSSSQMVCAAGVRESDALLALVGHRYGSIARSGKSICEEEYDLAIQLEKPVIAIANNSTKDPAQQLFLEKILDYEEGLAADYFSSLHELGAAIARGVRNLEAATGSRTSSSERCNSLVESSPPTSVSQSGSPIMAACASLDSQTNPLDFPGLDIGRFQRSIFTSILNSDSELIGIESGIQKFELRDNVGIQSTTYQERVSVFESRTVVVHATLTRPSTGALSAVFSSMIIDQAYFLKRLLDAFRASAAVLSSCCNATSTSTVSLAIAIHNCRDKLFGNCDVSSYSMAGQEISDPLILQPKPKSIKLNALIQPEPLAAKYADVARREFRLANRIRD